MRRLIVAIVFVWVAGFGAFVLLLPGPVSGGKTDAIVVPTGGQGRIERGLEVLDQGRAKAMLVTGVARAVKPGEFTAQYKVSARLMKCCVTLGFAAVNTRGNAAETAEWMREHRFTSLRLVTTDWHMRRAALELEATLPPDVRVVEDAVRSRPGMRILFLEYNKLIASFVSQHMPG